MDVSQFKNAERRIYKDKIIIDSIDGGNILKEYCHNPFRNSIYIRVSHSGEKIVIKDLSFEHSYFNNCKLRNIHFDNCSFVNCYFYNCDFSKSSFSNCDFRYSMFKGTLVNADIFNTAPRENNLLMKFSNNLRINYRDLGDKSGEDLAIQYELQANEDYLYDSWNSDNHYYRKKYQGFERFKKLIEWCGFKLNKFIWGNGESFNRLMLSTLITLISLGVISSLIGNDSWSAKKLFSIILGVFSYFVGGLDNSEATCIIQNEIIKHIIIILRAVFFGLFVSILIKKYSKR